MKFSYKIPRDGISFNHKSTSFQSQLLKCNIHTHPQRPKILTSIQKYIFHVHLKSRAIHSRNNLFFFYSSPSFSTESPILDLPQMAIFTKYVFILRS